MVSDVAQSPFLHTSKTGLSSSQYNRKAGNSNSSFETSALEATPAGVSSRGGLFSPLYGVNLYRRRLAAASPSPLHRKSSSSSSLHRILLYILCMIAVLGTAWFILPESSSSSTSSGATQTYDSSSSTTEVIPDTMSRTASSFSFEVWGRVQGVFFRKYTALKANELGLAGWVRNTNRGTVEGEVAGRASDQRALREMKDWLGKVGSPRSRIERAEFAPLSEKRARELLEDGTFTVRKTKR